MSKYDSTEEERKARRETRREEREKWGERKEGRRREELGRGGGEEDKKKYGRHEERKERQEGGEKEGGEKEGGEKGGGEKLQPMQSYIVGREYEQRRWRMMEPVWPSCHEQLPAETGQQEKYQNVLINRMSHDIYHTNSLSIRYNCVYSSLSVKTGCPLPFLLLPSFPQPSPSSLASSTSYRIILHFLKESAQDL